MVENKETEPESVDTGIKTVCVDVIINDVRYCGDVHVDAANGGVVVGDILALCEDDRLWARDSNLCGRLVSPIQTILKATALHEAGRDDLVRKCYYTGWYGFNDDLVITNEGEYCFEEIAVNWNDDYYYRGNTEENRVRDGDGDIRYVRAPESYFQDLCYCEHCDCYIQYDGDYYGDGECIYCHRENASNIIEGYSESHEHSPVFFGSYKGEFAGLGFELEVDCDDEDEDHNTETAENLCSHCGLEEDEMRYAHDGSLNYGFEIISQPHTVKDFWDKADKWRKMLSYLSHRGYTSHNAGTCGLHVHVSRAMFGKTFEEQNRAISKVYAFFDENWNDLVRVSRRADLSYCDKNRLSEDEYMDNTKTLYEKWRNKRKGGSHYVALNNSNSQTFEYRLGRGTLNAWSFFSWVDLIITITKNARRITIDKVTSNDLLSWLGGIRESTAKYIYRRGAFKDACKALYPAVEWESDMTDNY